MIFLLVDIGIDGAFVVNFREDSLLSELWSIHTTTPISSTHLRPLPDSPGSVSKEGKPGVPNTADHITRRI